MYDATSKLLRPRHVPSNNPCFPAQHTVPLQCLSILRVRRHRPAAYECQCCAAVCSPVTQHNRKRAWYIASSTRENNIEWAPKQLVAIGVTSQDDLTNFMRVDEWVVCEGGFYEVRSARCNKPSGTLVAVKAERRTHDDTVQQHIRKHFLQDIKALMLTSHPNVESFRGICHFNGATCLVTPWADGGNLREYLKANNNAVRRDILLQVALGLVYLHSQTPGKPSIVHGDIHIKNILMHNNVPIISDFGLCEIAGSPTPAGASRTDDDEASTSDPHGHYTSLAPEIALERNATRTTRSDVYSFAILIYEVFAGHRPFHPESSHRSALIRLCAGKRPDLSGIKRSDFTDDLWRLTEACWAQESSARPDMPEVHRRLS